MTYDSTILAEANLVAYYPLNETTGTVAHDKTSNAFNGTLHGTITLNQTKLDVGLDACMLFDGSSGYITLPAGVQIAEPITLEMWLNISSIGAGGNLVFSTYNFGVQGYEFGIEGTPTDNFYIALNTGSTHGGAAFSTATVYYVAYTIDASQNATGFTGPVGGTVTQQVTANPGGTLSYGPTVAQIGARWQAGGPGLFFAGNISSVAIYNRVLSTSTMNAHITAAHTAGGHVSIADGLGGVFT